MMTFVAPNYCVNVRPGITTVMFDRCLSPTEIATVTELFQRDVLPFVPDIDDDKEDDE